MGIIRKGAGIAVALVAIGAVGMKACESDSPSGPQVVSMPDGNGGTILVESGKGIISQDPATTVVTVNGGRVTVPGDPSTGNRPSVGGGNNTVPASTTTTTIDPSVITVQVDSNQRCVINDPGLGGMTIRAEGADIYVWGAGQNVDDGTLITNGNTATIDSAGQYNCAPGEITTPDGAVKVTQDSLTTDQRKFIFGDPSDKTINPIVVGLNVTGPSTGITSTTLVH